MPKSFIRDEAERLYSSMTKKRKKKPQPRPIGGKPPAKKLPIPIGYKPTRKAM